jgi:hypothetical protein
VGLEELELHMDLRACTSKSNKPAQLVLNYFPFSYLIILTCLPFLNHDMVSLLIASDHFRSYNKYTTLSYVDR